MMNRIKKIFFIGVFLLLNLSFLAQFVYGIIMLFTGSLDTGMIVMGLLSVEWLVLIAARYLSKKSAGSWSEGKSTGGYTGGGNFRR